MKKPHPILQLHDVDLMLAGLREQRSSGRLRKIGLDAGETDTLVRARDKLARQADSRWVTPYERALKRYGRGVVAVRDRVCQGCYIQLPTSKVPSDGETLTLCESCGRVLYWR